MRVPRLGDRFRRGAAVAAVLLGLIAVAAVAIVAIAGAPGGGGGPGSDGGPVLVARVGEPAPAVPVPMLDGKIFRLEDVRGHPVWINVWASWCPPCRVEFPDIDVIRSAAEPDGLVFLAVNFGEDIESIRNFLRNTGYTFQVGLDLAGQFEAQYGVTGLPMHIFIARDGSVDSLRVGGMTPREMEEKVAELTATAPPAGAAAPAARPPSAAVR